MGTNNAILVACLIDGLTRIENAAQEPEVDDMIGFLNSMGGRITRTAPTLIEIEGVKTLRGTEYTCISDRNEAVTMACAAMATGGSVTLHNISPILVAAFTDLMRGCGASVTEGPDWIHYATNKVLSCTSIETGPHPGFMTDWHPQTVALLTQARGTSEVVERVYSSRFAYVSSLRRMGAQIELFDPRPADSESYYYFNLDHSSHCHLSGCRVYGGASLHGGRLSGSDIRGDAALLVAALLANGTTVLESADHILRGYENFAGKLSALGASVILEVDHQS